MPPSALLDRVSALNASFVEAEKLYADQLAPTFNPFAFIETDELGLSRILGWLLDPRGDHAQADRFLHALVSHLRLPWLPQTCATAQVTLEAPTPRLAQFRRIDILVVSSGQAIAIENKPTAEDQPNQVQDYLAHLDQHFAHGGHLIYLSGTGGDPDELSIGASEKQKRVASGQLIVLGYGDLLPWLDMCRHVCRAPRVSAFIAEFQSYIQRRFKGERNMTARDNIVTNIVSSPAHVASAMQLIAAAEALRGRLIEMLDTQLRSQALSRGWTLLPETRKTPQWSGFRIRFGAGDSAYFKLEFGDENRSSSYFGIWGLKPADANYANIQKLLTDAFGRGRASHASPWLRNQGLQDSVLGIGNNWQGDEKLWVEIVNGKLAPKIISAAQMFYDVLQPQGLVGRP